jgi:hypothetical protein
MVLMTVNVQLEGLAVYDTGRGEEVAKATLDFHFLGFVTMDFIQVFFVEGCVDTGRQADRNCNTLQSMPSNI